MMTMTASIVVYNENEETLEGVLDGFSGLEVEKELIVVDNSPTERLRAVCESRPGVKYLFPGKNLGFGAGHNLAFSEKKLRSQLHMVINPDIRFDPKEMEGFLSWLSGQEDTVLAVPMILNPDGTRQHAVREIPTPLTLLKRRLNVLGVFDDFIAKDEWHDCPFEHVTDIPFAHGAFLVFKTEVFEKLGGFDERFFMYMEDVDIFLRARQYGKTVLQPHFSVMHEHRRASAKKLRLLWHHIVSAYRFYKKHGCSAR
jgi:GT2 family glycosyltransferase